MKLATAIDLAAAYEGKLDAELVQEKVISVYLERGPPHVVKKKLFTLRESRRGEASKLGGALLRNQ